MHGPTPSIIGDILFCKTADDAGVAAVQCRQQGRSQQMVRAVLMRLLPSSGSQHTSIVAAVKENDIFITGFTFRSTRSCGMVSWQPWKKGSGGPPDHYKTCTNFSRQGDITMETSSATDRQIRPALPARTAGVHSSGGIG